ncbi:MAG: WhiB family transcriptional regulator [Acidimicrobiales bacterium]
MDEALTAWLMSGDDRDLPTLAQLLERPPWMAEAACGGAGVDTFFPERGQSVRAAKALCAACTVRDDCLALALATDAKDGVWAV